MSRRVMVTGAGGFVGSHVFETLQRETDWDIICVDSYRHNGGYDTVARLLPPRQDRAGRFTCVTHDLTVPFSDRQLRRIGPIDYIVSVASRCHVGESIAGPAEFIRNNVNLMVELLEFARTKQPTRLVHVSTDEVYGPHLPQSLTDHFPSSPYAASKAAQEDLCQAYARTYGLPITIVNSANMFGERQSQLAYIPRLVKAISKGETVEVHCRGPETPGSRNYSYVRNVADAIVSILRHTGEDPDLPRLILPGQREVDNLTLAHMVAERLGQPLRWQFVSGKAVRPGYDPSYPDFGELVGDSADAKWWTVTFDEGLDRAVPQIHADLFNEGRLTGAGR